MYATRLSVVTVSLLTLLIGQLGCSLSRAELTLNDPLGRQDALELNQRDYTNYVRWSDYFRASSYVHPDVRDAFLESAPEADLRFSDYETAPFDIDETLTSATVRVRYLAYNVTTLYEYNIEETQEWRREGRIWSVRPSFKNISPDKKQ